MAKLTHLDLYKLGTLLGYQLSDTGTSHSRGDRRGEKTALVHRL
ncbi:MAG: hypothetical protein LEGION0403_FIIPPAGN_01728 [Legionella sp.]